MSLAEMKEKIRELTPEERLDLSALLIHLDRQEDPEHQAEMNRRMRDMDKGKKFTLDDLERAWQERQEKAMHAK